MSPVFANTSFYLALLDEGDGMHVPALRHSKTNRAILTTEFIILELGNACARAEDHGDFLALLAGIRASPRTLIVPLDSRLFQRGLDLFASRSDKDWCVASARVRDGVWAQAVVFAPEYGNEDEHQIRSHICSRDSAGSTSPGSLAPAA